MKILFLIFFIFLGLSNANFFHAQSGQKKSEKKSNKTGRSLSINQKSLGNADQFANSKGRKGFFSRAFHKKKSSWTNQPSGSFKNNYKLNKRLFFNHSSDKKIDRIKTLSQQNSERMKDRKRKKNFFEK